MNDPLNTAKIRQILGRREFLAAAGGLLSAGALGLEGCGGSGSSTLSVGAGSSMAATGAATLPTKTVSVVPLLPPGLQKAKAVLLSGFSEARVGQGPLACKIYADFPTLISVVDPISKRVVLIGMADPSAASTTLDSANVAATLMFLALGGSQEGPLGRKSLWSQITGDPAAATLAATVQARLQADSFALENGDAQIKAALAAAVTTIGFKRSTAAGGEGGNAAAVTNGREITAQTRTQQRGKATPGGFMLPPVSSPPAGGRFHDATSHEWGGTELSIDNVRAGTGLTLVAEYCLIQNGAHREAAVFIYQVDQAAPGNTTDVKANKIDGPLSIPARTDQEFPAPGMTLPQSNVILTLGLQNPQNDMETIRFVGLVPLFDAPEPPLFSDPLYASQVAAWRAILVGMWERSLVGLAGDVLLEALGWGGRQSSIEEVSQVVTGLSGLNAQLSDVIHSVDKGTGLDSGLQGLTGFAVASDQNMQAFTRALAPISPVSSETLSQSFSENRTTQGRALFRLMALLGVTDQQRKFGPKFRALTYSYISLAGSSGNYAVLSDKTDLFKILPVLKAAYPRYIPGGPLVSIELDNIVGKPGLAIFDTLKAHWTLTGAGDCTLSDGGKNRGREFDQDSTTINYASATATVTFTSAANATGPQTVSVELIRTLDEVGIHYSLGKATVVLTPATTVQGRFSVDVDSVDIAGEHITQVKADVYVPKVPGATGYAVHCHNFHDSYYYGDHFDISFDPKALPTFPYSVVDKGGEYLINISGSSGQIPGGFDVGANTKFYADRFQGMIVDVTLSP